jgi:hypothetical protein
MSTYRASRYASVSIESPIGPSVAAARKKAPMRHPETGVEQRGLDACNRRKAGLESVAALKVLKAMEEREAGPCGSCGEEASLRCRAGNRAGLGSALPSWG